MSTIRTDQSSDEINIMAYIYIYKKGTAAPQDGTLHNCFIPELSQSDSLVCFFSLHTLTKGGGRMGWRGGGGIKSGHIVT